MVYSPTYFLEGLWKLLGVGDGTDAEVMYVRSDLNQRSLGYFGLRPTPELDTE